MSHSDPNACKISMLWNWYTVNSCFIARSWHVRSKAQFAGSCIGVFLLVVLHQWLHRFAREYDAALIRSKSTKADVSAGSDNALATESSLPTLKPSQPAAMANTMSHKWFVAAKSVGGVYATPFEHLVRTLLFTVEWGVAYIIMLLFMYYNGYIIISCILGAFFGRLFFTYNEQLSCSTICDSRETDRKCCP